MRTWVILDVHHSFLKKHDMQGCRKGWGVSVRLLPIFVGD